MSTWAPDQDGLHPYVVSRWSWGKESSRVEYAASLAEAKRQYGWTRERFVSIKVRRAKLEDMHP